MISSAPSIFSAAQMVVRHSRRAVSPQSVVKSMSVGGNPVFDLVTVGAGPAGVAAVINAAFEGHKCAMIDQRSLGGGAQATPLISNIPGFPTGISGNQFATASRAQAMRLGVNCVMETGVARLEHTGSDIRLLDSRGNHIASGRRVLLATGVRWRELPHKMASRYTGHGLFYEVPESIDTNSASVVLGAGNSGAQAVVYMASRGVNVHFVYRGSDLRETMSATLADQIERLNNVTLCPQSEVANITGKNGCLNSVTIVSSDQTIKEEVETSQFLVMIGGVPSDPPECNLGSIVTDERGYIVIDHEYKTSVDGVYAAGDGTNRPAGRIMMAQCQGIQAGLNALKSLS